MHTPRYVALILAGIVAGAAAYTHEAHHGVIRRKSKTYLGVDGAHAHQESHTEQLLENLIESTAKSLPHTAELPKKNLSVGVVIAISIALGLGVTFLIGCITTATLAWTKTKSRKGSHQIS